MNTEKLHKHNIKDNHPTQVLNKKKSKIIWRKKFKITKNIAHIELFIRRPWIKISADIPTGGAPDQVGRSSACWRKTEDHNKGNEQ